jgi:filamentous hemagglutinin
MCLDFLDEEAMTTSVSHHGSAFGGAAIRASGSEVDLSHGTLSADQINVVANAGSIDASGAAITAKGPLVFTSAQAVDTGAGKTLAQQLRIGARDWSNVGGEVLQSGSGDTDITLSAPDGRLDNTAGHIAVNSVKVHSGGNNALVTNHILSKRGINNMGYLRPSADIVPNID